VVVLLAGSGPDSRGQPLAGALTTPPWRRMVFSLARSRLDHQIGEDKQ